MHLYFLCQLLFWLLILGIYYNLLHNDLISKRCRINLEKIRNFKLKNRLLKALKIFFILDFGVIIVYVLYNFIHFAAEGPSMMYYLIFKIIFRIYLSGVGEVYVITIFATVNYFIFIYSCYSFEKFMRQQYHMTKKDKVPLFIKNLSINQSGSLLKMLCNYYIFLCYSKDFS